jgi:methionyl-tRNA formyltransferase
MSQYSKIVFFGSGPVASATLESISQSFEIEAIVTKPRPPHHRSSVPVLDFASSHNIKVYTPANKHELSQLLEEVHFESQLGVVVDYGIIMEKTVIEAFPKGIINSHFSLLPEWRGADPITFSILSGQTKTGVSLMLINEKLDEGELLAQQDLVLEPQVTTPKLTDQLVSLSNEMLKETVPKYLAGSLKPYPQPDIKPTYSRLLVKSDGEIDIGKPADQLEREVRAYTGWPKSHLKLFNAYDIVVNKSRVARSPADGAIVIACGNNTYLEITELTAPSGRRMSGADFVRGYKK